jgi:DNA-binding transcriptional regulator LsrR (DeoR family)
MSGVAQMSTSIYDRRLILKVCHQFYRLGLSQTEIAEKLGVSRFQVARMLRTALEDGYVVVKILEPERWHADLEQAIEERYGLKTAIVVDNDNLDDDEVKRRIGDAAGRYLLETLSDGDTLGVSLGSTIQTLVDQLPDRIHKRVEVVQLIGGSPHIRSQDSPAFLTTQLADLFRARSHLLYAPAVVGGISLRDSLLADSSIKATYAMYHELNVAVLGIGALAQGTTSRLLYGGIIDETLLRTLLEQGAVGDVLSYIYRVDGSLVATALDDCVVAIPLQDLLRVPCRIGVAAGMAKVQAIEGALRGGFINVLVTDSMVAKALCNSSSTGSFAPSNDQHMEERTAP